jgi:hypothetical protein
LEVERRSPSTIEEREPELGAEPSGKCLLPSPARAAQVHEQAARAGLCDDAMQVDGDLCRGVRSTVARAWIGDARTGQEGRVDLVGAEEERGDPKVEAQVLAEERGMGARRVIEQLDDAVADKRGLREEAGARLELGLERRAEQVEGEIEARPASRNVVLEVREEPLVAEVDLGGEADEDDVAIERVEIERTRELLEPEAQATIEARLRLHLRASRERGDYARDFVVRAPQRGRGPSREPDRIGRERSDLLVRQVEALEAIVGLLALARAHHREPDQEIDALDFGQHMLAGGGEGVGHESVS